MTEAEAIAAKYTFEDFFREASESEKEAVWAEVLEKANTRQSKIVRIEYEN